METPVIPEANLQDPDVGLFQPEDVDTDTARLSAASDDLLNLIGRLIGRSGDLRELLTGAAVEFSDLVCDSIQDGGQYNDAKWREASMALLYCSKMADVWAEDVSAFRKKRGNLIEEFNRRLRELRLNVTPSHSEDVAADWRTVSSESENHPISPMRSVIFPLLSEFNQSAKMLIDEIRDTAEERARMLANGPTAPHVRKLVDGGYMGYGAYNILGAEANPPLPLTEEEGAQMARELGPYLRGEKEADERYYEILAALSALNSKAVLLQEPTEQDSYWDSPSSGLRHKEIQFYKEFFAELDEFETGPYGSSVNVIHLMDHLSGKNPAGLPSDWSDAELTEFASVVGNGLLVLSDSDLGGGTHLLPPSVANLTEGRSMPLGLQEEGDTEPEDYGYNAADWFSNATALGRLLDHTDPTLTGGREFSADLAMSTGHYLHASESGVADKNSEYFGEAGGELSYGSDEWNDSLSTLMDVAARNEDASHLILSGEYTHPSAGSGWPELGEVSIPDFEDSADALEGLYTFDWNDDGRAVAGLTDWIPDAAASDDPDDQRRATEATVGLLDMTTDEDRYEAYRNTGHSVDGIPNASIGLVNPHVARSFQGVMEANLEDFSRAAPQDQTAQVEIHEDGYFESDYQTRMRYMEYFMADDESAVRTYHLVNDLDSTAAPIVVDMHRNAEPGGEPEGLQVFAERSGTMRALMDGAVRGEAINRTQNTYEEEMSEANQEEESSNLWHDHLRNAAFAGIGFLPHPAARAASTIFIGGGFVETGAALDHAEERRKEEIAHENYQAPVTIDNGGDPVANPYHPYAPNSYGQTYTGPDSAYKLELDIIDAMVRNGELDINTARDQNQGLVTEDQHGSDSVITYQEANRQERQEGRLKESAEYVLGDICTNLKLPNNDNATALDVVEYYLESYEEHYDMTLDAVYSDINTQSYGEASQRN